MRKITLIVLLLFLYGCGYSSIYKNQKSIKYHINILSEEGDREMNNLIKNEIKLYSSEDSKNIYNFKLNTNYEKKIITKNSSGVITDYNLSATSIFSIDLKDKNKKLKFEESINIKNLSDTFEQNINEKNIKKNFASSIREKLISVILSLNDN